MDTLNTISAPHQLVVFRGESNTKQFPTDDLELPIPAEMISLFEAISGWVVEFRKSPGRNRPVALIQSGGASPRGEFVIADMSAEWPAQRPTASRQKCDQFLRLLSDVVMRSQMLEDELKRSQQFLANQAATLSDSDHDEVHDCFIPRHPYLTQSELHSDFIISDELNADADRSHECSDRRNKAEATIGTDTVEAQCPVPQWQIGGRRGIHESRYVDWAIRNDHRIELIVGQIESPENFDSRTQEWESKLTINPETSRFWFSVEPRGCYWLFDQTTCRLNKISEFNKISQLNPQQALIVTTADFDIADSVELVLESQVQPFQNADDLASAIQDYLQTDEPLLVLLRQ